MCRIALNIASATSQRVVASLPFGGRVAFLYAGLGTSALRAVRAMGRVSSDVASLSPVSPAGPGRPHSTRRDGRFRDPIYRMKFGGDSAAVWVDSIGHASLRKGRRWWGSMARALMEAASSPAHPGNSLAISKQARMCERRGRPELCAGGEAA